MKHIINGRTFNTETASSIAYWSNSYSRSNPHYAREELFQTRGGAFFLIGEGGPLSRYGRPVGSNGRAGGEDLLPLSIEDAKKWLEDHDEVEAFERLFGEPAEARAAETNFLLRLTPSLHEQVKQAAAQGGTSMNGWLVAAIEKALAR